MRFGALLGASFTVGALAISFARPAAAEILIRVDKETQTMTVTVDRLVTYVWPVSTGMEGRDTPSGTFQPNRMDADHHSQEWDNAPMPHTIFFDMHGHESSWNAVQQIAEQRRFADKTGLYARPGEEDGTGSAVVGAGRDILADGPAALAEEQHHHAVRQLGRGQIVEEGLQGPGQLEE